MSDAVSTLAPLLLFMLIPVWIPLVAVVVSTAWDVVRGVGRRQQPVRGATPVPAPAPRRQVAAEAS